MGCCCGRTPKSESFISEQKQDGLFNKSDTRDPMGGKTADRRVQRTQRLLHQALTSLILEKKYDAITVRDILDRADAGRSTFYLHYRDKDELLTNGFQYLQNFLESVLEASQRAAPDSCERIIGFSLPMFEHALEYRRVNGALLGSSAESVVHRRIHFVLAGIVLRELKVQLQNRKRAYPPVSPDLLGHFVVSTFTRCLLGG